MRKIVAEHQLDLVEFPNWEGLGWLFSFRRRVPVVVRLHTSSLESQLLKGTPPTRGDKWDARRERWLTTRADAIVTHSEAHRQRMAEELAIDSRRIAVVPHGIPVYPHFRRPPPEHTDPTVVYLGRMEKRKGTLDLLRAIPLVLREVPAARFVLIGADRPHCPGGRTHAQFVREELPVEVQRRIQFEGPLPDEKVNQWLQTADLFVAPSLYESFGLIFLEAMRWGTPVVGTHAGGIPEVVQDGKTGLLVPPECPAELAQAIVSLLQNEGRRRELGDSARRRVESSFTVDLMAERAAALYGRAIEEWHGNRNWNRNRRN
jgi:glycosyltransferase involved in cell wall biosynthesis